jgi:hypothetical protein
MHSTNSHFFALIICVDSSSEDQVGKTVAIIVGVLAGVAVLIVLLSVCRKAMGKFSLIIYII